MSTGLCSGLVMDSLDPEGAIRVLIVDDPAVVRQGLRTFREIAQKLVIDEKTVKTHVRSILSKLHLEERTQAAIWALRHSLAMDER